MKSSLQSLKEQRKKKSADKTNEAPYMYVKKCVVSPSNRKHETRKIALRCIKA